jgi:hypothetical protein
MKIDTGGHQVSQTGIYYDFKVVVKRSCDDDDLLVRLVSFRSYASSLNSESNSSLICAISRTASQWFIVRFQEVGYVQGGSMVESMYAVQSAMEIALKNSMLVSNLKANGKISSIFLPRSC